MKNKGLVKVSTERTGVTSFNYTLEFPDGSSTTMTLTVSEWAVEARNLSNAGWGIDYIDSDKYM